MEISAIVRGTVKAMPVVLLLGLLAGCGGGGGEGGSATGNEGNQLSDAAKYSGLTTKAKITTANAVAFTSDAFAAASAGSSAEILGKMVPRDSSGNNVTLPEIATLVQGTVQKTTAKRAASQAVAGASTSNAINGAAGGSAAMTIDVDDATGNFTGKATFSSFKETATGPTLSGTVTLSGYYNKATGHYDRMSVIFAPLSAVTAKGTFDLYGNFVFSSKENTELLTMSCTLHISTGNTYWIKDWTYTLTDGNTLVITGRYYHPQFGFVEISTPWRMLATSFSAPPTSGIFQAAGTSCTKARLTFTATGSTVTATVEGTEGWVKCTE